MVPRNRAAVAAAPLPEDETLTRKAVQLPLGGHPPLRWPCTELILSPCHERTVIFALPLIERTDDVSTATDAAILEVARGTLTTGERGRIALLVETFARAIDTTRRRGFAANPLQILGLADFDETDDCSFEEDDEICANRSRSARSLSWLGRMSAPSILVAS